LGRIRKLSGEEDEKFLKGKEWLQFLVPVPDIDIQ